MTLENIKHTIQSDYGIDVIELYLDTQIENFQRQSLDFTM